MDTTFRAKLTDLVQVVGYDGAVTDYEAGTPVEMSNDYVGEMEAFDADFQPVSHDDHVFVAYLGRHKVILTPKQFELAD